MYRRWGGPRSDNVASVGPGGRRLDGILQRNMHFQIPFSFITKCLLNIDLSLFLMMHENYVCVMWYKMYLSIEEPLVLTQGFVIDFYGSSIGRWAILQPGLKQDA